jgi:16S rRNA processing protein RimM
MSSGSKFTPQKFEGYHCVGWVSMAHGIRGEAFVRLYAGRSDWHSQAKSLSLLMKGTDVLKVLSVQKITPHKDGLIVKFAEVRDRNQAEAIAKSGVYITEDLLQSPEGEPVFLKQIEGFEIVDKQGVLLGKISGFGSNGPQDLLKVDTPEGKEALVPLVDAFLVHIDFDKQRVTMDLPPGLFSLEE